MTEYLFAGTGFVLGHSFQLTGLVLVVESDVAFTEFLPDTYSSDMTLLEDGECTCNAKAFVV